MASLFIEGYEPETFNPERAAQDTWDSLCRVQAFKEGNFNFASVPNATLKVEADELYKHPREFLVVMSHFALHPRVRDADVITYVPDGMRPFMRVLSLVMNKPLAHVVRKLETKSRYDFMFASEEDEKLAFSAKRLLIGEDVVTSLGSVAGVRQLLPAEQEVHSLALLLRGSVRDEYKKMLTSDNYLLEREIPTDKDEFRSRLEAGWYA